MRIMLFNPPATFPVGEPAYCPPPLGLASLAAVLENSVDIEILDCLAEGFVKPMPVGSSWIRYGLINDEIEIRLTREHPDIVAISAVSSDQWDNVSTVLSIIKEVSKKQMRNICTIVGGPHATFHAGEIMKDPRVDFVIMGEGEGPLYEFCECWRDGLGVSQIEGLVYRDFMDQIVANPRTGYIENLDYIPLPARKFLIMEKYLYPIPHSGPPDKIPHTVLKVSRGCPGQCVNCAIPGIFGTTVRLRSVEKVLEEIQLLVDTYGVREIQFEDTNLLYNKEWAMELFAKMAEKGWGLSWCASSGLCLWNLDDDVWEAMKKSGCYCVWLDVESGSQRVLSEVVRKQGDLAQVKRAVKAMRKAGIAAKGIFSLGFPGETKEDMNATVNVALSMGFADLRFQIATPYPGMPMWDECHRTNAIDSNISFKELMLNKGSVETSEFSKTDTLRFWEWGTSRARFRKALFDPTMLTEKLPLLILSAIRRPAETMVSVGKSINYLIRSGLR